MTRPLAPLLFLGALCGALTALPGQDKPAPARPIDTPFGGARLLRDVSGDDATATSKWTLWISYLDTAGDYLDHATYLADLQKRYRDRGLRVAVGLPAPLAARVLQAEQEVAVVALEGAPAAVALAPTNAPANAAIWPDLDGAVDRIEAALGGDLGATMPGAIDSSIEQMLGSVGDGGDYKDGVAQAVRALPRSGRARALAVLEAWWCRGDYGDARAAVDAGIAALADEAVPLCLFADLVLRGDRADPSVPRQLAMALAPAAASAPEGRFTQLVYLRALLRAGQDKLAAHVVEQLEPKLAGQAMLQLVFAETLMDAGDPRPWREHAERAIELARRGGVDPRWAFGARHKVLARTGASESRLVALMGEYRRSDVSTTSLNNDAWYMVTQPATMGRFDTLALANAEEMLRQEGARMDPGNRDTVALVLFVNGQLERAVAEETTALQGRGEQADYRARLTRFENALAEQRARLAKNAPK